MISICNRLLFPIQQKAVSLFCKLSTSASTKLDIRFDGKNALVTGAGRGIGRHLAIALAEAGARVLAVSRTPDALESLRNEGIANNLKISTLCLDVRFWMDVEDQIYDGGPFDLLVNNVGVTDPEDLKPLGEIDETNVDDAMAIGVHPTISITQLVAKDMIENGKAGAIVNISSVLGVMAAPRSSVFCATKGAVEQLTRAMAVEYGQHKIRVNSIVPSVVRTERTEDMGYFSEGNSFAKKMLPRIPLGRFAETQDLVGPVLFLLSDHAAMVTGVSLPVDGGVLVTFTTSAEHHN